ncbi:uncharacterized protein NFIA_004570 [Aspergillus fischeri NRRL 181]|uniref:Uncharacterized protein n=1 Tax=Neosartorya fischeri (strain ATCC 1020 / DSM 3700 / CBS 544.65 / FGSC A1164 / JCM 1740 / NRRL 181 / WB 181) TaxID=331117 RepID=A1DK60_NEOFI|nr:uncharacterized protein NFIA_004570 [Aspergillus fischeri NRRL 181]EAW17099.1 hypothetical protein NFIA_004570 [Aspergillus fischeri NRRL 181]
MKWKYMGHSESTVELYIVVQCDKTVSKKVKDFFAQEHVARDLGTDFRLHVVEEALTRFAASNDIRAFGNFRLRNTLCGVKVQLSLSGMSRTATIGGLIMVTTTKETLFGITAGHPLSELREQIEEPLTPPDESGTDDGFGDHESETLPETGGEESLHGDSADEHGLRVDLGRVTHDSFLSGMTTGGNHDWALIELKHENWLPNRLDAPSNSETAGKTIVQRERRGDVVDLFCPEQQSNFSVQPAVAITCRGIQRGTLTQNNSSVLMYPGKAFVETLEFTPDSNSALGFGDSGCWVVNELTGEVYGHIVSMDAFGEAYVMPIQGMLSDIQVHLQAEKVNLPTSEGIALLQSLNTQSVTKKDQPMPSRSDLPRQAEVQDTVSYPETQQETERTRALLENSNHDARVVSDGDPVQHRLSDRSELLWRELSQEQTQHAHTRANLEQHIMRVSETLWETRQTVRGLECELSHEREMKEALERQLSHEREMKEALERQLSNERKVWKGLERELFERERRKGLETAEKRESSEERKERARKRLHEGSTIHINEGGTVFNATRGETGVFGIGGNKGVHRYE